MTTRTHGGRRSIRAPSFDYATPGAYWITICAQDPFAEWGAVRDETVELAPAGQMVDLAIRSIPEVYQGIVLDRHVVMPNHAHLILVILDMLGALSLFEAIDRFKTYTTNQYIRGVKEQGWPRFEGRVWQRNYYERVVRNEEELRRFRGYIDENPLKWELDEYHPTRFRM